ncbi:MAG: hypothetical protein JWO22_3742 [Frankiales bacterium]|nr:hypothetical protein [Frankiales bacterium]
MPPRNGGDIAAQHAVPSVPGVTEATATIETQAGGLHRVELAGSFGHPHWLAFLCSGLSAKGVAVVSGKASRPEPMRWEGHFLLDGQVDGLDVIELAGRRSTVRDSAAPALSSYSVVRRTDGDLELKVQAPDALGFLGRLLSRVSLLTLLPAGLEIATVNGGIVDTFVLSGIGSAAPSAEVVDALEQMLAAMTPQG